MIIYRIYKMITVCDYDASIDDYRDREEDVTIKYVSSKQKVQEFLNQIEAKNKEAYPCTTCPIISLTKRTYNNGKHEDLKKYCNKGDIFFEGNRIFCKNVKSSDFTEYFYEEIEVE